MKLRTTSTDKFEGRHIGPGPGDMAEMLNAIGVDSLEQLIDETVPAAIRLNRPLRLKEAMTESAYFKHLKRIAGKNKVYRTYIGLGYNHNITPSVIRRNVFENPGWYTQYTPYQAEIAQGRLEALLNFQTMVADLTGLEIANASLLDEGTAAAEAMIMFYHHKNKKDHHSTKFFLSDLCYPQTIDIIKTKAEPLGIELITGDHREIKLDETFFGALVQYPAGNGALYDYSDFVQHAHEQHVYVTFATDLLALALIKSPGELGADCAVGNSQRFGVPLGYGGPHAAFFSTRDEFKRNIPGRIIGVSVDRDNRPALRMALQTREQHIRREKATSNICTAQALLAIMASMYAVYHGADGIKSIAEKVHGLTCVLNEGLKEQGHDQANEYFFDTLYIKCGHLCGLIRQHAVSRHINFYYYANGDIQISLDETTELEDVKDILEIFAEAKGHVNGHPFKEIDIEKLTPHIPAQLQRSSTYLTHPVFNLYHSESEMMRYIKKLENKDLSLTTSMIPLGSCTMKLNAATELIPVSWPEFAHIHPFVPVEQVEGYFELIQELERDLCEITGFQACSLQPNSGAQGEYAGLMVIRAYHIDHGNTHRNIVLIPASAHGTNPASAIMAGMEVIVVKSDEEGHIDMADLKLKAAEHTNDLAALMVTYPSTHGVYEETIIEICRIIHEHGGLVYMDGANMNAQVGLTSPATIGADVCHLNLHKTFAIPHGGGGPGTGPICVNDLLKDYLPGHPIIKTGGDKPIHAINAAPYGSASILIISYAYIKLLGKEGCTNASKFAILNANYLKSKLEKTFEILFVGKSGRVAHEFIIDFRNWKHTINLEVEDVAKRLMDYGFHAPTVSFPVAGTLMVEPTESESKEELDRFCDALMHIRREISEIENGSADKTDNVLKNAPHTLHDITATEWNHSYSREKAVYPSPLVREKKFWPSVSRINNTYGDRNLICTCPPIESYMEVD